MYLHTHVCACQHTLPQDSHQHPLTPFPMTQGALRILLKQPLPIYQYYKRVETCFLSFVLFALQIRSSEVPKLTKIKELVTEFRLEKKQILCLLVHSTVPIWNVYHTHSNPYSSCLLCVLII